MRSLSFLSLLFALTMASGAARASDSHAGYYYPEPTSRETYTASMAQGPSASKRSRVGFTVGINKTQQKRGYAPRYHIFAKGADAQKLIIVGTGSSDYNTLFRLRALMASLTADARATPLFANMPEPENLNFLDLCKLIGFTQVTVSDGDTLAHRIDIR
ncbi:hypothetical protein ACFQ14_04485 [Pseudahrensia aquimaris]|uniref:Molybdopterin-guanine dinucleotide biosynthesis protein A n=1 Tax=Pseudahrensia aquimaris TaxID=744461 RepID=A0ABW3FBT3_9HYPH